MDNHILIGLGGTGGRVLAAYRKLVFEKFGGNLSPDDLWIRYLYVDSSASDLKMDDPKQWEVMGTSVKFDSDSVLPIKAADLSTYVNNRSRFKGQTSSTTRKSHPVQQVRSAVWDVCFSLTQPMSLTQESVAKCHSSPRTPTDGN